ncbi:hypothetical protein B0H13DRAFT_84440 [Mycena leptocephala]|nr:hypothetical protein B0H13DRAFT_84440 [Mycena leptocephala]
MARIGAWGLFRLSAKRRKRGRAKRRGRHGEGGSPRCVRRCLRPLRARVRLWAWGRVVVGVGCDGVRCARGGAGARQGGERKSASGSSLRPKGASTASTSTFNPKLESGEEARALHWKRRLGLLARSVAVRQLRRLLRRRGPHRLILIIRLLLKQPRFRGAPEDRVPPQRLVLFFDAGPWTWIVQPMAFPCPCAPLCSMEPVDREHAPHRADCLAPGEPSTPSAAQVGIMPARARGRIEYMTPPGSTHSRLWLHSADRVGTAIASTSVTQRSAPLQNDKHPALAAAWKICMRGLARAHIHPYHCRAHGCVWYQHEELYLKQAYRREARTCLVPEPLSDNAPLFGTSRPCRPKRTKPLLRLCFKGAADKFSEAVHILWNQMQIAMFHLVVHPAWPLIRLKRSYGCLCRELESKDRGWHLIRCCRFVGQ